MDGWLDKVANTKENLTEIFLETQLPKSPLVSAWAGRDSKLVVPVCTPYTERHCLNLTFSKGLWLWLLHFDLQICTSFGQSEGGGPLATKFPNTQRLSGSTELFDHFCSWRSNIHIPTGSGNRKPNKGKEDRRKRRAKERLCWLTGPSGLPF